MYYLCKMLSVRSNMLTSALCVATCQTPTNKIHKIKFHSKSTSITCQSGIKISSKQLISLVAVSRVLKYWLLFHMLKESNIRMQKGDFFELSKQLLKVVLTECYFCTYSSVYSLFYTAILRDMMTGMTDQG